MLQRHARAGFIISSFFSLTKKWHPRHSLPGWQRRVLEVLSLTTSAGSERKRPIRFLAISFRRGAGSRKKSRSAAEEAASIFGTVFIKAGSHGEQWVCRIVSVVPGAASVSA